MANDSSLGPVNRHRSAIVAGALALVLAGCGNASTVARTRGSTRPAAHHRIAAHHRPAPSARAAPVSVPALIPPANFPARSVTVPVLTYHRVHTLPAVGQLDLIVDPANFLAEMHALKAAGYHTIHQWQLFDALYKGARLPPKPIIVSVDDGYLDDVRTILPDLERLHMVGTFFVITGRTSEPGFLDADQIRELDRAGMDVGDHTAHHVDLSELSASELEAETAGSRHVLDGILGHPVYYFAYPFGDYDATVEQALRRAGFTLAYTTQGGTTETTADALTLPRIHVGRSETPSGLLSLVGGA